ncbi:MAG: hypothetical protein KDH96_01840 [Candidatus Riesia sp.]|nr:hypothetical protein [Candidatus Riesia sp.]
MGETKNEKKVITKATKQLLSKAKVTAITINQIDFTQEEVVDEALKFYIEKNNAKTQQLDSLTSK